MARPRVHDELLKQRLLDAASVRISREGASSLSLRSVAGEAGTTTAAVYSLFGDKQALVAAVVGEGFRRFAEALDAVPRTENPRADLLALGVAYRQYAIAQPHFYLAMFDRPQVVSGRYGADNDACGEGAGHEEGAAAPTFEVLVDAAARAMGSEAGEARSVATYLWALAHGLVSLELNGLLAGSAAEREEAYIVTLQMASV